MGRVVVWWGTPVEIRSAFSRLKRDGEISEKEYRAALARVAVLRTGWRELMPGSKVRDVAETLPDLYGLRAMDAMQLAAGLIWCFEKPSGRLFACCDTKLREAAEKAGFTVIP
ncbi:MAG: type II toxin-antitoxin system VapC family toxin [Blastocatellia bacterium]|nr:type II toxin-antitoxin system VapC family toxin [Blastocatellia bacterium]